MEGKANQDSEPLGTCHRLFNFLERTLAFYGTKPVTLGTTAPKLQEEKTGSSSGDQLYAHVEVEDAKGSQLTVERDVNGEPLVMIPVVEILGTDDLEGKNIELRQRANDVVEKKGQQTAIRRKSSKKKEVLKKKPSTSRSSGDAREKERVKDTAEVLKKDSSTAQAQGKDEGSKVPSRPAKPTLGEVLNIDEKSGAFIQSKKEALRVGSSLRSLLDSS